MNLRTCCWRVWCRGPEVRRYLPTDMAGGSSSGRSRQIIDRILEDLTKLSNALEPRQQSSASPRSLTVEDEMHELFHRRGSGRSSSTSSASVTPSTSTWPRFSRPITSSTLVSPTHTSILATFANHCVSICTCFVIFLLS